MRSCCSQAKASSWSAVHRAGALLAPGWHWLSGHVTAGQRPTRLGSATSPSPCMHGVEPGLELLLDPYIKISGPLPSLSPPAPGELGVCGSPWSVQEGGLWWSCPQRAGWAGCWQSSWLLWVPWGLHCGCRCCVSPARSTLETSCLALAPNEGAIKLATKWEEGRLVVAVSLPWAVVLDPRGCSLRMLLGKDRVRGEYEEEE